MTNISYISDIEKKELIFYIMFDFFQFFSVIKKRVNILHYD